METSNVFQMLLLRHWEEEKDNIGTSISSCAHQFSSPIVNATRDLLDFITEQSQISFEAQNLVLSTLAEVNDFKSKVFLILSSHLSRSTR